MTELAYGAELGYAAAEEEQPRVGFFTDTSVCIGCKACEVACKEWNLIPADGYEWTGWSYDNTRQLDANSWRHVAFIEQEKPSRVSPAPAPAGQSPASPVPGAGGASLPGPMLERTVTFGAAPPAAPETREGEPISLDGDGDGRAGLRWLMSSDVCKHCTHAACLDVCPTGALFRTEFGTVVVQEDVCNGCGYCVPACPFGVIDKRELPATTDPPPGLLGRKEDGRVWKCTLCYDRLKGGHEPACAKACPTDSIQFGPLDELRERADARLAKLESDGWNGAQLYGRDPDDGVGGFGAFFLLLDDPEVYGLPPDPVVTTKSLPGIWAAAAAAAGALVLGVAAAFAGGAR